jgi:hypothetical protein
MVYATFELDQKSQSAGSESLNGLIRNLLKRRSLGSLLPSLALASRPSAMVVSASPTALSTPPIEAPPLGPPSPPARPCAGPTGKSHVRPRQRHSAPAASPASAIGMSSTSPPALTQGRGDRPSSGARRETPACPVERQGKARRAHPPTAFGKSDMAARSARQKRIAIMYTWPTPP